MSKKILMIFLALLVILPQPLLIFPRVVSAEGVSNPKAIEYVLDENDIRSELRQNQSVFMNYFKAKSNVNEDAGEGRKITKIEFLMAGEVVKTVSVNAKTFNQSVIFDGKPYKVQSKGNKAAGSWFAWTIGAHIVNEHAAWEAGQNGNWDIISSVTPPQSPHGRFMFDDYPGHDVWIQVDYARNVAFTNSEFGQIPTTVIDRAPNRLDEWNPMQVKAGDDPSSPGNVRRVMDQNVIGPSDNIFGRTDPSTKITEIKFNSLEAATIKFNQDHKKLGVMSDGGAQTFFFANYEYDITSYTYRYPNVYRVYSIPDSGTGECELENPECVPPQPDGECVVTEGTPVTAEVSDPRASAVIKADQRDIESFDVADGIPTSESLYGNVLGLSYLFKNKFTQMNGTCTYNVPVTQTYNMEWTEPGPKDPKGNPTTVTKTDTKTVTKNYTVKREFNYWVISNFEVNSLKKATLENYAFEGNKIEILPQGYSPPTYAAVKTAGYTAPQAAAVNNPPKKVGKDVPDEDFTSDAEKAIGEVQVRNDSLTFKSQTVMDGVEREKTGPTPGTIPQPTEIGRDVLYKPNNVIPNTKENRLNEQSKGSIEYGLMPGAIGGGEDKAIPILGINTVTIHTPVVDYAILPDSNRPFDQRMQPDMSRTVLILDRPFTINFDERGQHRNIKGYGNRDYQKYTLLKRVIFPFPVYSEDKSEYYDSNTWINIPVGQPSMSFKMPTWVDEGQYRIDTEAWAINSQGKAASQHNFNGDLQNYGATESFEVTVVGRLFGFRIWDIGDLRYENVFRTTKGETGHTRNAYFSGGRDENGNPTTLSVEPMIQTPIDEISNGELSTIGASEIPNGYVAVYKAAAEKYGVPWNLLAGVHRVETVFSTNMATSSAGAVGHMQFMPCTWIGWRAPMCLSGTITDQQMRDVSLIQQYGGYGTDADGDGYADPYNLQDAVYSAAKYLAANGAAEGKISDALYMYNHDYDYVRDVMYYSDLYVRAASTHKQQVGNVLAAAPSDTSKWILPIRPGSHPTESETVPHNGYSILFDFKTMGNLWNPAEGARIDPTFWYIPKNGGPAQEVDLYYDLTGSNQKMIKVGSAEDVRSYSRFVQLNDEMRNISQSELSKSAAYEYKNLLSPAQQAWDWDKFSKKFAERTTKIGAGYKLEVLNYQMRTLIGPQDIPASVNPDVALRSVQHWFGEYNLPVAPRILPKGTSVLDLANRYGGQLDGSEAEFLKDGYLMVNFGIYTLKNNDQNTRVLGYKAPIADMWQIEGQVNASVDSKGSTFNFKPGDIAMFETDYSVRNDFEKAAK